jgi:hypothetical protein
MNSYTFLFVSESPCCNLQEIAKMLPEDAELSDGDLSVYWTTNADSLKEAIEKVIEYLNNILHNCGVDWKLDGEYDYKSAKSGKVTQLPIDVDGSVRELLEKAGLG